MREGILSYIFSNRILIFGYIFGFVYNFLIYPPNLTFPFQTQNKKEIKLKYKKWKFCRCKS
ncbi:hypothetical protein LEP1GSC151_1550 [Leptospira interrogans serovar Grippotyphosa str. LT2186]|uniref:Uncharacterized protein n=1 Tax=Leptospira interrogans serovar Grippotyphosa str. LT2186 TaxID=1001599 RepID=M3HKP5_LEPIR|nr:hypothetical protein LEP1GSC151_1550 [Leptospira interrogans serovar Grippotyphosa str. LT2186]